MHRAAGVLAVLGSVMIGMPLVMAGSASADAVSPRASTPRLHMSVAASPRMIQSVSHLGQGVLSKATTGARAASVSPVPSYLPACYGDSRNMATVGGALDPASFGAFYNCSQQEWTFEVQTADAWAPSALGDWVVGINVDGNINNNCGGWEDAALVAQTGTPGQFVEEIGTVDSSCNFVPLYQSLSFVITSNSVAISLPWSTIGDSFVTGLERVAPDSCRGGGRRSGRRRTQPGLRRRPADGRRVRVRPAADAPELQRQCCWVDRGREDRRL